MISGQPSCSASSSPTMGASSRRTQAASSSSESSPRAEPRRWCCRRSRPDSSSKRRGYPRVPMPGTTPTARGFVFLILVVANAARDVRVSFVPTRTAGRRAISRSRRPATSSPRSHAAMKISHGCRRAAGPMRPCAAVPARVPSTLRPGAAKRRPAAGNPARCRRDLAVPHSDRCSRGADGRDAVAMRGRRSVTTPRDPHRSASAHLAIR